MTEEEKPQEDECFDCPLYDDGRCSTRYFLKLVHGDDFPIVGCGVRENALRSAKTESEKKAGDKTPTSAGEEKS
jgi:hypothetical protein